MSAGQLIQKFFFLTYRATGIALLAACAAAYAQEKPASAPNTLPAVTVTAMRGAVEKSYRKMIGGMDLFQRKHAMAPDASLRFVLLPRRHDTDMDRIVLEILGDSVTIPVPVAPDHTFTLVRDRKALEENAAVTPNRRAQTMTWRTDIRTPGLPPDTRRLGDLRLECEVGFEAGLVSNFRPKSFIGKFADFLSGAAGYCSRSESRYLFFADRPVFGVALVAGARRQVLRTDMLYAGASDDPDWPADLPFCDCEVLLDRAYFLPLGDRSWPDDTLVEFEYMEGGNDQRARESQDALATGKSTKADVMAALGNATVVNFDSCFEVWVYRMKSPEKQGAGKTGSMRSSAPKGTDEPTPPDRELVVLFAPSGVATKARVQMSGSTWKSAQ